MPSAIVGDRDPRTTSLFWQALFENMGTQLKFSSAYHPQTDGQSEIANSTVLDLLKCYVSDQRTDWEKYLPLVEFAYNNTVHSSTSKAPFEVIYGRIPSLGLDFTDKTPFKGVMEYAERARLHMLDAHDHIIESRTIQAVYSNPSCVV